MNDTAKAAAQDRSDYVAALHREAEGYIKRENWKGLDAVNAELKAQGEKPLPKPGAKSAGKSGAGGSDEPKPAKKLDADELRPFVAARELAIEGGKDVADANKGDLLKALKAAGVDIDAPLPALDQK